MKFLLGLPRGRIGAERVIPGVGCRVDGLYHPNAGFQLTPLTAGIAIGIQTVAASFVSKQLDTLRRQQGAFARSRLRPFALVGQ